MENAIPVTRPDNVIDVLHDAFTEFLSMKKNTVEAKSAIEISQNVIPVKSFDANIAVFIFLFSLFCLNKICKFILQIIITKYLNLLYLISQKQPIKLLNLMFFLNNFLKNNY